MTRRLVRRTGVARGLMAIAAMMLAPAAAAQQPTAEDAKAFLKDMLLSQAMGLPQNGDINIEQVAFKDDCTMVLAGQSRMFIVKVDFKKANLGSLDEIAPTQIIIERGVTIYRATRLLQPEDSSTIDLSFYTLGLAPRVNNALSVLHSECYGGNPYPF